MFVLESFEDKSGCRILDLLDSWPVPDHWTDGQLMAAILFAGDRVGGGGGETGMD